MTVNQINTKNKIYPLRNGIFQVMMILALVLAGCEERTRTVWLDELKIRTHSDGIPSVAANTTQGGLPITMNGVVYERGVGVQTISALSFLLDGNAARFTALVGADDSGNREAPVKFYVIGDRKVLYESPEMIPGDKPQKVNVSLKGIKRLALLVTCSKEGHQRAYSNWADAKMEMYGDFMPLQIPNDGERYILTPTPGKNPRITSSRIFGARPGNPFLFTIRATGERPVTFSAENLPMGLSLDAETGIITGKVDKRGTYLTVLKAENASGQAQKELKIVIGDTIALTPPLGWNGWNSWARNIDRQKVVASAGAMVNSGLSDHGWTYINIDDAWQGQRDGKYNAIQPNEKFPQFQEMIAYIHSLGLKTGIYSTPWISSYAGYVGGSSDFEDGIYPDSIVAKKREYRRLGKYSFENNDAQQFAEWGIDYLKYDWRIDVSSAQRMSEALKRSGRDILYSLSNSAPFEYATEWAALANMWRTGPDIRDSWLSLYISAFTIDNWAPFAGPGHWNDPDMLILGNVTTGTDLHPTRLTPDEQYSHVSIYSLLSAPLLIGCPIEQLDDFTLNLLTNDEVIEINQDPLGKPGRLISDTLGVQTWIKPLEDGSFAAGLFYTDDFGHTPQSYFRWGDETAVKYTFDFEKAGLHGKWLLRDVWRQKDLGIFEKTFGVEINHHGVVFLRMFPKS